MKDRVVEIGDVAGEVVDWVAACEVAGQRTRFRRRDREIAVLISRDEYLAMRETVALSDDDDLRRTVEAADAEASANRLILPEDLFES